LPEYRRREAVSAFLGKLEQEPDIVAAILFGSLATGEYMADSDADFFIILKQPEIRLDQAIGRLMGLDAGGTVEPFGYGLKQVREMIENLHGMALNAFGEGILLYCADEATVKELEQLFEGVCRRYRVRRTETGWGWTEPQEARQ
jgi:hypothetical protein